MPKQKKEGSTVSTVSNVENPGVIQNVYGCWKNLVNDALAITLPVGAAIEYLPGLNTVLGTCYARAMGPAEELFYQLFTEEKCTIVPASWSIWSGVTEEFQRCARDSGISVISEQMRNYLLHNPAQVTMMLLASGIVVYKITSAAGNFAYQQTCIASNRLPVAIDAYLEPEPKLEGAGKRKRKRDDFNSLKDAPRAIEFLPSKKRKQALTPVLSSEHKSSEKADKGYSSDGAVAESRRKQVRALTKSFS